jgi:hypothetical protein
MFTATSPILAVKTINAINDALAQDQGRLFRYYLRETMPLAEDAYRSDEDDGFRSHLGASLIGKDCVRELWYTFRWARKVLHEGRMLRLFNRGHLEEPRFVALLKMIGCEVWQYDEKKKQFRVAAHDGHFGGSLDAVVRGVPDVPHGQAILGEFKTHNDKSFQKLKSEGVRSAKLAHFVQMQIYMGGFSLPAALYLAVNKNDDDLYGEIVLFDPELYSRFIDKSKTVIQSQRPLPKVNNSPGWFQCKFCDFKQICHFEQEPDKNCRTCVHASPTTDGKWICGQHKQEIDKAKQLVGCSDYRFIPM